jgi:polyhydroxyalkanoate synthesis repressor PhaR
MATQATKEASDDEVVTIKKYANRRLYNTQSSSYITLEHLSQMTREGVEYKVLDAKTGDDITHQILTQIIMEEESSGGEAGHMLPVSFLRQLISMYGNSLQSVVPHYLEASMDSFQANRSKLAKAFETSLGNNPLARLTEHNMSMFKVAASAFMPGGEKGEPGAAAPAADVPRDDLASLREQMAEMQKKLDALSK